MTLVRLDADHLASETAMQGPAADAAQITALRQTAALVRLQGVH